MSWKNIIKDEDAEFNRVKVKREGNKGKSKMFENMKEEIKFNLRYMGQTEYILSTLTGKDDTIYQNIRKEINEINKSLRKIEDTIKSSYAQKNNRKNYSEVSDQEAYEQDRADVASRRQ